jgi:uncharacterized protein (DUF433 family)
LNLTPTLSCADWLALGNQPIPETIMKGIEKTEGVCGGSACIEDTRIPVYVIYGLAVQGADLHQITMAYPHLTMIQISTACLYAILHEDEMKRELKENELP